MTKATTESRQAAITDNKLAPPAVEPVGTTDNKPTQVDNDEVDNEDSFGPRQRRTGDELGQEQMMIEDITMIDDHCIGQYYVIKDKKIKNDNVKTMPSMGGDKN